MEERAQVSPELNKERQLVELTQSGDLDALGTLYDLNVNRVFRYSVLRLGNPDVAVDVTEEVFLAMVEGLEHYKRKVSFSAWLMRIARKEVNELVRKNRKIKNVPETSEGLENNQSSEPQISSEEQQQRAELSLSIKELPEFEREVIALRFAAGLTVEETAMALGKKPGSVKKTQNIAMGKLKVLMGSKYPELLK